MQEREHRIWSAESSKRNARCNDDEHEVEQKSERAAGGGDEESVRIERAHCTQRNVKRVSQHVRIELLCFWSTGLRAREMEWGTWPDMKMIGPEKGVY